MKQTAHLSNPYPYEMRDKMARTRPGQAHWAEGPQKCRECSHFTNEGYYAASNKMTPRGLKPGHCREFKRLTGEKGERVPPTALICRFFNEAKEPPPARDPSARFGW